MKIYGVIEISDVLRKHGLWLNGEGGGTRAVLRGANLGGANLRYANLGYAIPKIEKLHTKIAEAIAGGGCLKMDTWHTCKTTHCRAGWAIEIAGEAGKELECRVGSAGAGALIFAKSYPSQMVPDFYADNETALADIKWCASEELDAKL